MDTIKQTGELPWIKHARKKLRQTARGTKVESKTMPETPIPLNFGSLYMYVEDGSIRIIPCRPLEVPVLGSRAAFQTHKNVPYQTGRLVAIKMQLIDENGGRYEFIQNRDDKEDGEVEVNRRSN